MFGYVWYAHQNSLDLEKGAKLIIVFSSYGTDSNNLINVAYNKHSSNWNVYV